MLYLCLFVKTPNRRGTISHEENKTNFVMNSQLDPIGDRSDVRELLTVCIVCTLCTACTRIPVQHVQYAQDVQNVPVT